MTGRRVGCIVALALAALLALTCRAPPAVPSNVVVVLVDTLRSDRLGVYGNPHGLTPAIDTLAGQGTVFRRAYAQSSWTVPSVASLFTSRFPSQHGVNSVESTLDAREDTLAEALKQRGYATAGFVANLMLLEQSGLAQGFDHWEGIGGWDAANPSAKVNLLKGHGESVNRAVFGWLDGRTNRVQPVFLYIHYMEPHVPYDPPRDVLAARLDGAPPPDYDEVNRYAGGLHVRSFPDALLPAALALYDAEVVSVDKQIGRLLDGLRRRGVLGHAIIAFVADHGQQFKEHGLIGHSHTLFQEVIRVPLLIAASDRPRHRDIDQPAALVDVAPTVIELLGGTVPAQFEGRSWARDIGPRTWWATLWPSAPERGDTPVFSELIKREGEPRFSPHERAVIGPDAKLVAGVSGTREYYDLRADPGEHDPDSLALGRRAALDAALARLQAIAVRDSALPTRALDDQTRERMRALGYAD